MRKSATKNSAPPRPSKARKAHTYRAARRNFARKLVAARIEPTFRDAVRLADTPYCDGLREFCAAHPRATAEAIKAEWTAPPKAAEPEPVAAAPEPEAPKPKKPRTRKPAAPKDVAEPAAPKAPRKTAAKKPADAAAKPKAAPRRRAPAAA